MNHLSPYILHHMTNSGKIAYLKAQNGIQQINDPGESKFNPKGEKKKNASRLQMSWFYAKEKQKSHSKHFDES